MDGLIKKVEKTVDVAINKSQKENIFCVKSYQEFEVDDLMNRGPKLLKDLCDTATWLQIKITNGSKHLK